jgi:hypothetical protein
MEGVLAPTTQIESQRSGSDASETDSHAIEEGCLMARHPTPVDLDDAERRRAVGNHKVPYQVEPIQGEKPDSCLGRHTDSLFA